MCCRSRSSQQTEAHKAYPVQLPHPEDTKANDANNDLHQHTLAYFMATVGDDLTAAAHAKASLQHLLSYCN